MGSEVLKTDRSAEKSFLYDLITFFIDEQVKRHCRVGLIPPDVRIIFNCKTLSTALIERNRTFETISVILDFTNVLGLKAALNAGFL